MPPAAVDAGRAAAMADFLSASATKDGAAERERDDQLRELDVRDWLERVLDMSFEAPRDGAHYKWIEELQNGAHLCRLLECISPELKVKYQKRPVGVWAKRDNLSIFIDRIKSDLVGVPSAVLFEITDLLPSDGSGEWHPRNVVTCLYHLIKIAHERYGVEPPGMLAAELEIDQMSDPADAEVEAAIHRAEDEGEAPDEDDEEEDEEDDEQPSALAPAPPEDAAFPPPPAPESPDVVPSPSSKKYKAVRGDEIDQQVKREFNTLVRRSLRSRAGAAPSMPLPGEPPKLIRLRQGQYLVLPMKKVVHMRVLRGYLMVRVGGGWKGFEEFMQHMSQFQATKGWQSKAEEVKEMARQGAPAQSAAQLRGKAAAPAPAGERKERLAASHPPAGAAQQRVAKSAAPPAAADRAVAASQPAPAPAGARFGAAAKQGAARQGAGVRTRAATSGAGAAPQRPAAPGARGPLVRQPAPRAAAAAPAPAPTGGAGGAARRKAPPPALQPTGGQRAAAGMPSRQKSLGSPADAGVRSPLSSGSSPRRRAKSAPRSATATRPAAAAGGAAGPRKKPAAKRVG
eukprot:TRINITY_DN726_c0_g2_i1.p1 TRINITY_DN726_c0_g2~~TRINITY_DN726_c0_g2_i1.p1  ORF type:complete len:570 (+),score=160.20 TRINITY_DN726_c0_g2_i1:38-1747(+)